MQIITVMVFVQLQCIKKSLFFTGISRKTFQILLGLITHFLGQKKKNLHFSNLFQDVATLIQSYIRNLVKSQKAVQKISVKEDEEISKT